MKQLIHNITTSISLPRTGARRLVLLLAALLVGVGHAWGNYSATVNVYSSPSVGGKVYIGTNSNCGSNSCSQTSDYATQKSGFTFNTSGSFTFYLCNKPASNYVFKGWATSDSNNSGSGVSDNPWQQSFSASYNWGSGTTHNRYAIFARMTTSVSSLSFGNVTRETSKTLTFDVVHAHAGTITISKSGTNADNYTLDIYSITSSQDETTTTVTVTFNPSCNGTRTATLTISSNNGLSDKTIFLSGNGVLKSQTLSWVNESSIETNMLIGSTQTISATATPSNLPVSYSSSNTSVLTVDASGNLTAKGLGTATITASQAGDCTYSSANIITKTITVRTKETPRFNPVSGATYDKKVDDSFTIALERVSDGLQGDFKVTSNPVGIVSVQRDADGNLCVNCDHPGTTTLTLTQTENDDIFAASATYTINITRYANELAATIPTNYYVGESKAVTFGGNKNSDAAVQFFINGVIKSVQRNPNQNYRDSVISYTGTTITAWNKGTATFTITQPQNNKYEGFTKTVTVHVDKRANTLVPTITAETLRVEEYATLAMAGKIDDVSTPINIVISDQNPPTPSHPNPNGITDVITRSDNTITAQNAGTAKITITQDEDYKYIAADTTVFSIQVNKHEPSVEWNNGVPYYFNETYPNAYYTSIFTLTNGDAALIDNYASTDLDVATFVDGVVTTYNVDRSTTLSIHLAENYKWKERSFTKMIYPRKKNNHVEFVLTGSNFGDLAHATETSEWGTNGLQVGDPTTVSILGIPTNVNWGTFYCVIKFEGIPDSLFFNYRISHSIAVEEFGKTSAPIVTVFVGDDENHLSQVWEKSTNSTLAESKAFHLQPTTRVVKFQYKGNYAAFFNNIKVTELHQFDPNPRIIDFGVVNVNKHPQEIAEFSHANAGYKVEVAPSLHFDASPTIIPNTGGDRMGTQPLAITFHPIPDVEQSYDERIYFTDQLGNKDSIIVRAQTTKIGVPEFTWNPLERPYYCSPTNPDTTYYIPNICSSSNPSRPLVYETLDNKSGIAKVINDTLYIYTKTPQEVTIKVSQPEVTDQWMAHEETYTFTTRLKPELSVPFVMTEDIFVNKNYTIYSPLWSRSGIFNVKWTQHNDQYGWDNQYGIRLGGEDQTAWADWHAFDYPWLPSMSWEDKYAIFEFEGAPDSLFFTYFTNKGGILGVSDAYWYVAVGKNGKDWNVIWEAYEATFPNNDPSLAPNIEMALPHDARFIKFCYSGNFAGYFKDIRITAFDGYYFLKTSDNLYLSRGGATPNVSAVVDDYGIAIRKSKVSNSDNSKKFTRLEYVDNGRYLCQSGNSLITNETSNVKFVEKEQTDGTVVYTNINEDRYIAPNADRTLTLSTTESQAIRWHLEKPSVHEKAMAALNDEQVRSATFEFGEEIESLDKLRGRLFNEDYTKEIVLDTHHETSEQQEVSNGSADVYPNGENGVVNNLKEGLYRLSVKALYRIGPNKRAIEAHVGGYDCPTAYVYVDDLNSTNKAKTRLHSVYDFAQGENKGDGGHPDFSFRYNDSTAYYPNGTTSATYHFGLENSYENDVYIFIHKDENTGKGSLRYGIKAPSNANDSNWLCYQRITLTRLYRKEFIFDNGGVDKDSLWNNSTNWEYEGTHNHGMIPGLTHKVIIDAPVIVTGEETGAYSVSYGENAKGSIIVKPEASLSVREGGFSEEYLGTQNHITLEANEKGQTGALFLCPGIKAPNATVQFYSVIANPEDNEEWDWQYIGSPVTKETVDYNERLFYNCWLYQHNTITDAWSNAGNWNKMEPFRGYMFTRNDGKTGTYGTRPSTGPLFAYSGQLNLAKDTVLTLQYEGGKCDNFIANSWAAPIAISKFNERDFVEVEKTIYIWDKSGQCFTVAPFTSGSAENDTLPAMQGFMVKALSKNAKLCLNYESLVWKNDMTNNSPLKAPMRNRWDDDDDEKKEVSDLLSRVRIDMMSADSIPDHLYLIEKEGEGFSREFTEGYDAPKYFVDGLPCIYTYETSGPHLAVSATDDVVGTYLAINTNASQNYTLSFSKVIGEGLGLRDLVTNTIVPITEGMQYTFSAPANSSPMLRFVVVEHEETQQWNNNNGTSLEDVGGDLKIWQSGEILSVIGAGSHASLRLYDAAGKLILSEFFNEATAINLTALPTGIYMVQVNDKTEKVLR